MSALTQPRIGKGMQARHASSCTTSTLTGGWTSGEWREGKVPDLGGGGAGGVCEVPRVVGAEVTQSLIEQAHGQALTQASACCPPCGRMLRARGPVLRTVETLVGTVTLEWPYFYCTPRSGGLLAVG